MDCPSCHAQAPDGAEDCPACGIIFAKWRAREERLATAPAAGAWKPEASPGGSSSKAGTVIGSIIIALQLGMLFYYLKVVRPHNEATRKAIVEKMHSAQRAEEVRRMAEEASRLRVDTVMQGLQQAGEMHVRESQALSEEVQRLNAR